MLSNATLTNQPQSTIEVQELGSTNIQWHFSVTDLEKEKTTYPVWMPKYVRTSPKQLRISKTTKKQTKMLTHIPKAFLKRQ